MRFLLCVVLPILANVAIFFLLLWKAKSRFVIKLEHLSAAIAAGSVVLTGATIVIAVLAVFGYREILERAAEAARKEANKIASKAAIEAIEPALARALQDQQLKQSPDQKEKADQIADSYKGGGA